MGSKRAQDGSDPGVGQHQHCLRCHEVVWRWWLCGGCGPQPPHNHHRHRPWQLGLSICSKSVPEFDQPLGVGPHTCLDLEIVSLKNHVEKHNIYISCSWPMLAGPISGGFQ